MMRRELRLAAILIVFTACSTNSVLSPQATSVSGPCGPKAPNIVYLTPADVANSASATAREAAAAYLQHSVIVLCGSDVQHLADLLKLSGPGTAAATEAVATSQFTVRVKHHGARHNVPPGDPPPVSTPEPSTAVPLGAVGFHLSHNGVVESFDSFAANASSEKATLESWISDVTSRHDEPPIGSWQPVFTNTENYSDSRGDEGQITHTYYRLNNFNTTYDWYMESERVLGTPKWKGCDFTIFFKNNGYAGYFNTDREVKMIPDGTGVVLYEHAPKTTESTKTVSFSIGKSLDKLAGGVTAEYSQSWSQSDVTIRDHTRVPASNQAIIFTPPDLQAVWSPAGCPPETAKTTFTTPHASIFQVPQGGSVRLDSPTKLTFMLWDPIEGRLFDFKVSRTRGEVVFGPTYTFKPPVFDFPNKTIRLSSSHRKATIHITARSGDSNVGWQITNQPYWVVLSQTHGLGDKEITIEAQGSTPPGSIANLNFDTDPRGGANNVETGPLILRVEYE